MSRPNKDTSQRLLQEFGRRIAQQQLPELKVGKATSLQLTVPNLDRLGDDFNSQLLRSAQLRFAPSKSVSMTLERTGDTVSLKFVKKF